MIHFQRGAALLAQTFVPTLFVFAVNKTVCHEPIGKCSQEEKVPSRT